MVVIVCSQDAVWFAGCERPDPEGYKLVPFLNSRFGLPAEHLIRAAVKREATRNYGNDRGLTFFPTPLTLCFSVRNSMKETSSELA